jgi:hypothetical protein
VLSGNMSTPFVTSRASWLELVTRIVSENINKVKIWLHNYM